MTLAFLADSKHPQSAYIKRSSLWKFHLDRKAGNKAEAGYQNGW